MSFFGDNSKEQPMHYGEVYNTWSHLMMAQGCVAKYQFLYNHCGDEQLRKLIQNMMENLIKPEVRQLQNLLKENGVTLPPAPQERPFAEPDRIPPGARFTDQEIATCISNDIATSLVSCSQIIGLSHRMDIARMFALHHADIMRYGAQLMQIMRQKGWLVSPPLYDQTPEFSPV